MIFPVSRQAYVFLWTIAGGMAIALVYDIFRIIRKAVRTGSLLTYAEDLIYWVIAAAIMLLTIYWSNEGEIRGFLFLGTIIGVVLYSSLLSKVVMESSLFIIQMTIKIVKGIIFIIAYPFRFVLRILTAPARKLAGIVRNALRKAGSGGKTRIKKLGFIKGLSGVAKMRKIKNVKKVKP